MSLSMPASACAAMVPPPQDWNRSGSVARLHRRGELGLERLVLEDRDVDLDVRVGRHVGVGDPLEDGLARVAGGDVPPLDGDRRGAPRMRGRRGGRQPRAAVDGLRPWRRGRGSPRSRRRAGGHQHGDDRPRDSERSPTRGHDSTSSCARRRRTRSVRATGAPPTSGAAKVSVRVPHRFRADRTVDDVVEPADRSPGCRQPARLAVDRRSPPKVSVHSGDGDASTALHRRRPVTADDRRRRGSGRRLRADRLQGDQRAGRTSRRRPAGASRRSSASTATSGAVIAPVGRRCSR